MIHHYISITTYVILFPFASYRKLFTGRGIDIHKQLSHVPKILFLDFFLKISLVESLLYFDSQNLKILVYQSLVVIFLTREYFNLHLGWLENIIGLGFEFICSLFEPSAGKIEQQKRVKEEIKMVKENKFKSLTLSHHNLRYIPRVNARKFRPQKG